MSVKYHYFHEKLKLIQVILGFAVLPPLLNDLVCIRIFEPASKLRSLDLIEHFFGLKHSRKSYYSIVPQCIELKEPLERKILDFGKAHYSFNFDRVF
jgi:hypothetical protein